MPVEVSTMLSSIGAIKEMLTETGETRRSRDDGATPLQLPR
jgi:hypothetical protein